MDLKNNQKNQIGIKKYILEKKNDSSSSLCSMDSGMDSVDSRAYSIDSFNSTFHERSLSIDSQELNNVIFIDESKKTNMHIQDDKNIVKEFKKFTEEDNLDLVISKNEDAKDLDLTIFWKDLINALRQRKIDD